MTRASLSLSRVLPTLLGAFLVFCILWRGGKGLEALWAMLLIVGCIALFPHSHSTKKDDHIPLWVWMTGAGFLVVSILSFAFSTTANYGFEELVRDMALLLLGLNVLRFFAQSSSNTEHARTVAVKLLVLTAIAATLVGCFVYLFQPLDRFVGSFFFYRFHTDYWPNAWAEFLLLAWPLALWLAGDRPILRILAVFPLVGALLLSYSRGGILAFSAQLILGCVLFFAWHVRRSESMRRLPRTIFSFMVIAVFSLGMFWVLNLWRAQLFPVQSVADKIQFTATEGRSSIDERSQFWKQSWEFALERPLLGWGPGSFRFLQPHTQEGVLATSDHPHNVFLKIAMERGMIALAFFVLLLLAAFVGGLRIFFRESSDREAMFTLAALVAVTGVLLHNQIDFNLQFLGIALPFTLLLAWLLRGMLRWQPVRHPRLRMMCEITLAAFLLLTFVLEGRFLALGKLGRDAAANRDPAVAVLWLDRARGSLLPRDTELTRAQMLVLLQQPTDALDALDAYEVQNAEDARMWNLRGDIERSLGRCVAARTSYDKAMDYGRWNLLGAARGSLECSLTLSDRIAIRTRREEFLQLAKEFGNAILQNAHFIALSQNVEEYDRFVSLLIRAYPVNADELRTLNAKVLEHALQERSIYTARSTGLLW